MGQQLEIRRATADQVNEVRDLTVKAYAKWVSVTSRKPKPMTADYDAAFRNHRFDCLYCDNIMVGLIETVAHGNELMVVNVAVDPDHQGQGYGVRLMRHAAGLAREAGLVATRLYTNKLMRENIELYERLGYRFEKETEHGEGVVAVHMVRPL